MQFESLIERFFDIEYIDNYTIINLSGKELMIAHCKDYEKMNYVVTGAQLSGFGVNYLSPLYIGIWMK